MTAKEIEAQVRSVGRTCRGTLPVSARRKINALFELGGPELARKTDEKARSGCGFDFNEVILANPLDGKEHSYTCPHCGVEGTYIAPLFEEESKGG